MATFKTFFKILKKYKLTMAIYVGIFIVVMIMNGNTETDDINGFYGEKTNFTVINRDGSYLGDAIIDYLSEKNNYKKKDDNIKELRNDLFYRDIYYVLIIPEGYENSVKSGNPMELENMKVNSSAKGYCMDIEVEKFIRAVNAYISIGESVEGAVNRAKIVAANETKVSMVNMDMAEDMPAYYNYFTLISYVIISVIIGVVGPVLMCFGRSDIKKRINCSSLNFRSYNMELAFGVMLTSFLMWIIFNVPAWIIYHTELSRAEIVMNLVNTFCLVLISTGIAFLSGNIAKNSVTITAITNILGLGMSFLSGVFVPLDVMSPTLRNIAKVVPVYWYVEACDNIMGVKKFSDFDMHELCVNFGIQILYAIAIFGVAAVVIKKFRIKEN